MTIEDLPAGGLAEVVEAADLRVLLMTLVHLTGDLAWLEPPFSPVRDVRLVTDPGAGLPDEVAARIRAAAVAVLRDADAPTPAIDDPGDELMVRMMSVCLGEQVPTEYAPMMREEMGFISRDRDLPRVGDEPKDVLIVGAGVSGVALGAQLTRIGIPYSIVERNAEVGGTWWENHYPGCGVDTPNHAYSFSVGRRHRWTRYFSLRDEIQAYLERITDELGVRSNVRCGAELISARWSDDDHRWHVVIRTPDGDEQHSAAVLVSAVGALNVPRLPPIPGIDEFAGPLFHSARWPDDIDLTDRHVAVIGTGATSMQLVPTIAGTAASITVYQRSPHWARSIGGYRDDIPAQAVWLLEHVPFYVEWFRFAMTWRYGDGLLRFLRKDPDWPHPARSVNRTNDRHRQEMTDFLLAELGDRSDLVAKCLPDYPPYGKRILIDNGWFRTLRRDDVELVTETIERIDRDGVVATDGTHRRADVIVMATGFQTTQMTARLNVTGRGGVNLANVWADDNPGAHLGITVPGFPNLFCMLGPNTALGHGGSAIFQGECQARYITAGILAMDASGIAAIDVDPVVHDEYIRRVDAEHEQLIWTHPGMTNWYRNAAGRVTALMPWRLVDYWQMTHEVDLAEFHHTPEQRS